MARHAYLVMAHNEWDVLRKLIGVLDDRENDIYLHIDSQADAPGEEDLRACAKMSKVYFVERRHVVWGGESLIRCEMSLFRAAWERKYAYYHLISGVDFPTKTQAQIHEFFDRHAGMEFIEYVDIPKKNYEYRIRYTYPLQEKIGRYTNDLPTLWYRVLNKVLVLGQMLRGKDRIRDYGQEIKFGSNWISVTHAFVTYLLEQTPVIEKYFYQGVAADELFVQTLCWNSAFREKLYRQEWIRLIDWDRGSPYTWQEEDLEEILSSPCLFVRKVTGENHLVDRLLPYAAGGEAQE